MIGAISSNMVAMPNPGVIPAPELAPKGPAADFMAANPAAKADHAVNQAGTADAGQIRAGEGVRGPDSQALALISSRLNGPYQVAGERLNQAVARMRDYHDRVSSGQLDAKSPEAMRINQEMSMDLLKLQIETGRAAFQVELATKVIEHGTSATKTVMQTQV